MSRPDYSPKLLTAEHLYSIPDDHHRYELDAGRLRVSEPTGWEHGDIAITLGGDLARHVRAHSLGGVVTETGFVLRRRPDRVFAPDVAFVRAERVPPPALRSKFFEGAPDLAVEIVSPSDEPAALRRKATRYLAAGTRLVWIVDPRRRTVTVHAPDTIPATLAVPSTLDGGDVVPGFEMPLDMLFGDG